MCLAILGGTAIPRFVSETICHRPISGLGHRKSGCSKKKYVFEEGEKLHIDALLQAIDYDRSLCK